MPKKIKILRAHHAGFCFGVSRAVRIAEEAQGKNIQTLGELIHNPEVLEELKTRGVRTVSALSGLRSGTVIIRAHGISDRQKNLLHKKNLKIIDASCPFVRRIHAAVANFVRQKIPVVIVGRRDHPEMRAVVEDFPRVLVVKNSVDARLKKFSGKKVGVLAQTTETAEEFQKVCVRLKKLNAKVQPILTICNATTERQTSALALAKKVDLMLVIGGKKSNNTKNLWHLTKKIVTTKWIETEKELRPIWFRGVVKIGITAGASTPEATIERVMGKVESRNWSREKFLITESKI